MVKPGRVVVVAVDGSEHSKLAFKWAIESVLRPNDQLHIINVHPSAAMLVKPEFSASGQPSDYYAAVERQLDLRSKGLLSDLAKETEAIGIPSVVTSSIAGDAREEICSYANNVNANMVIVGSRGMGIVRRTLLGSVSAYVTKHCSCPVLIVRETEHALSASTA